MVIEDEELRTLFKAESEEYLQQMDEGLLLLESNPSDGGPLDVLFRHAHNLKGAARMLGVSEVEQVAHVFEDALGAAKRREAPLTSLMIDRMCGALDGIRKLVSSAVTGEPAHTDADQIIRLMQEQKGLAPEEPRQAQTDGECASVQTVSSQIDTIRVDPQKLDALMTQTTELVVTKTRITHRVAQADQILDTWEGWTKHPERNDFGKLTEMLCRLRDDVADDSARLEIAATRLEESVRAIRLMPLSTIFNMFPRMVRDIARDRGKEVQLVIAGGEIVADKRMLEEMKDPLMHMVRNAIDHGIETPSERAERGKPRGATIRMTATRKGSGIVVEVADDGRGLNVESIKATALDRRLVSADTLERMTPHDLQSLIFVPGFSTSRVITDISGRGIGMDVVRTNVVRLKGSISVESTAGAGCSFKVQLPATLATSHVLLAGVDGRPYGLPLEYIHSTRPLAVNDVFLLDGRESTLIDGWPVSVVRLFDLLELQETQPPALTPTANPRRICIILSAGDDLLAVTVDDLLDEQEVILKPLGGLLRRVRNVAGLAILVTGEVCTVLNPLDLIRSAGKSVVRTKPLPAAAKQNARPSVLLVEDSITTRVWEKRGLEAAGYAVTTAVDGIDGLLKLSQQSFDAVVSDVEMPNMDGLTLTERIRQQGKHRELPVILVTSLATDADRKRGIDAGANAYIAKSAFDQKLLVETLERLI